MNILFLTQSKTLSVFFDVALAAEKSASTDKVGFYIADSDFYRRFKIPSVVTEDIHSMESDRAGGKITLLD